MKTFALGVTLLVLGSLTFAQQPGQSNAKLRQQAAAALCPVAARATSARSPFATLVCALPLHVWRRQLRECCVTANGNITQLETPQFHEHIAAGVFAEGYGARDASTGVEYFDYAGFGDSGNWGAPQIATQSATLVKLVRTTADGLWTLTQNITMVPGVSPSIKVAMALRNNSTVDRTALLIGGRAETEAVRFLRVDLERIELRRPSDGSDRVRKHRGSWQFRRHPGPGCPAPGAGFRPRATGVHPGRPRRSVSLQPVRADVGRAQYRGRRIGRGHL